jgi:hypothetical protein
MSNPIEPATLNGQVQARDALSGDLDAVPSLLRAWLRGDAESAARLNQAKAQQAERLRAEIRELAGQAVATLRRLVTSDDAPPAVRLRAALAVLAASDALKPEPVGLMTPDGVRATWDHRELIELLGG